MTKKFGADKSMGPALPHQRRVKVSFFRFQVLPFLLSQKTVFQWFRAILTYYRNKCSNHG